MIVDMFYWLMSRCGMTRDACRQASLTPYGFRHLGPDLTRRAGWPLEDRMELGRWSLAVIRSLIITAYAAGQTTRAQRQQAAGSLTGVCANLYSRGKAAMERELELRRRVLQMVRDYVAGRAWAEAVPVQQGLPTFDFMFDTPDAALPQPEDAESDGD